MPSHLAAVAGIGFAILMGASESARAEERAVKKAVKIEMVAEGETLQEKFALLKELGMPFQK